MTQSNMVPMFEEQCEVSQTSSSFDAYDIYLDGDIREPSYYRHAFQVLRSARQGDLVRIYISTNGGNLNSALMFKNNIEQCEADVIGIIEAEAYSAGGLIALSCPNIEVKPYTTMMCHSAAFGSGGIVQNVRDHVDFVGKHAEALMDEVYRDFLLPEELVDLKRGRELWFDYVEIGERLDRMFKARSEEMGEDFDGVEQEFRLEDMIESAVEKALTSLLDKYTLTEKPKPEKKASAKPRAKKAVEVEVIQEVVDTP